MNGYVIINCEGLELTNSQTQTIEGIHSRVKEAYSTGKPCLLYNCKSNSRKVSPIFSMVTASTDNQYVASAITLQMQIDSQDGVTITNMIEN